MLKKKDLKEGEIYTITDKSYPGKKIIHKYERMDDSDRSYGYYITDFSTNWKFERSTPYLSNREINHSTKEECHWLNCCIQADKFIPYEEAMKTFKPKSLVGRYLKYIGNSEKDPKYGDYFKIITDEKGSNLLRLSDNNSRCYWKGSESILNKDNQHFELMPEGFIPEEEKPQFEVGEWYKTQKGTFFKYLRDSGNCKVGSEFIHYERKKLEQEEGEFISDQKFVKIDLSEIQEYLPDGHPDKIKSMKETNCEFKVGDWVKCINSKAQSYDVSIENKPFKVLEIKNGGLGKYVTGFQKKYPELMRAEGGIYFTNLRKCTLQEIESIVHTLTDEEILDVCKQYYPVGTRFKSALNDSAPYIGLTGKTPYLEVVDNVKVVFNGLGIGFLYYQRNGFAEIISSPKECYSSEIEVGDEVEITDSHNRDKIGLKGILLKSDGTDIPYYVRTSSEFEDTWCKNVKLIKKASKPSNNDSVLAFGLAIQASKESVKSSNKPELIPIKVRNVSTFVTPKRIKTTITKPKLIY